MSHYKVDRNAEILQIAVKKLELRFPISELSSKLDYAKGNISNFLSGKKPVPDTFLDKFFITFGLQRSEIENLLTTEENKTIGVDEVKELKNQNIFLVPLVSQYAYGGFLSGYSDNDYMETLPTLPFYADHEAKGNYIAFEVRGESMENGTDESIKAGNVVICREINNQYWKSKLHIRKWDFFVIAHQTEGILIKSIIDHNVESGEITIHSLNPLYEDRILNLSEVALLYNVIEIRRKLKQ